MGIKSFFSGLGKWLFGKAKNFFDKNQAELIADLESLAKTAVLSVPRLLTMEDRQAAVNEILAVAKSSGAEWGAKLLAFTEADIKQSLTYFYTESDLKRYLGLARFTVELLQKTTVDNLPSTHTLLGVIQAALMDLSGE